jgi:two-component system, cell cycle response regulator DivK
MADYPKRILIVEDHQLDGKLLKDILESHGYETLQTGDGLEAIDLAVAKRPDLILMDIQLPHMSGLEVTRLLRGDERSRRIPIIAVTAFAMGWHEREALCRDFPLVLHPVSLSFGVLSRNSHREVLLPESVFTATIARSQT